MEVLELPSKMEDEVKQVRAAYRRLALQWHPDKNPDRPQVAEAKFKRVTGAYHCLTTVNFDFERCVYGLPVLHGLLSMRILQSPTGPPHTSGRRRKP